LNPAGQVLPVLAGDGYYTGKVKMGVAGETIVFGELCYFKASDSRWWKAKADVTATSGAVEIGFCVQAGVAGGVTTILKDGNINAASLFDTFTLSAPIFISAATAGKVTQTAPSGTTGFVVRVVGRGETADSITINLSPDYIELA
jgi:hypothetical protein